MAWYDKFSDFGDKFKSGFEKFANGITLGGSSDIYGANKNLLGLQAQDNVEIERQREDTRYQRLIQDLQSAGLNPSSVLGSSGGAVPSNGVSGSVGSNAGALGAIISSIAESGLTMARKDKTEAETQNINEDTWSKKLDNSIKENVGLLQAYANLDLTHSTTDEKRQAFLLADQQYAINSNKIIQSFNDAEKSSYEKTKVELESKLLKGEFDERSDGMLFSGEIIHISESQLASGKLGVNLKKAGIELGGSGSQSTEHCIPLGVLNAALDENNPRHNDALWAIKNVYLGEDIGTIRKNISNKGKK